MKNTYGRRAPGVSPARRSCCGSPSTNFCDEAFVALNINETLPVRDVLGFTPRAVRSVASDVSMLNLIAAGFGIGIVPQTVSTYGTSSPSNTAVLSLLARRSS